MNKLGWALALFFAVVSGVLTYTFILKGNAFLGEDGRTTIVLTETEKARVLGEMRNLLEGVQIITGAIAADDMELVAEAATNLGMKVANADSPELIAKLPLEVKTMGLGAHAAFDALAETALNTDDRIVVLTELSTLMETCVACHGGYRIAIENFDE